MTANTLAAKLTELPRESLLRLALKLDAAVTGANGLAYVAAAGPLEDLLGLDPALTRAVGAFLIAFALGVWAIAARSAVPLGGVRAVIAANALWVAASLAAAAASLSSPTTVGTSWIILQALVVGGFASLQAYALRRAG